MPAPLLVGFRAAHTVPLPSDLALYVGHVQRCRFADPQQRILVIGLARTDPPRTAPVYAHPAPAEAATMTTHPLQLDLFDPPPALSAPTSAPVRRKGIPYPPRSAASR